MTNKNTEEKNINLTCEEELENIRQESQANLAGWKKALADYQNLQKENEKRLSQLKDFLNLDIISQLLPIFDNYQIALSHIPEQDKKQAWAIGLEHIFKLWESFLQENGVKAIESLGEKFNPEYHESIGEVKDEKVPDQQIVEVKQIGYLLQEKVLRPSKVIINNLE